MTSTTPPPAAPPRRPRRRRALGLALLVLALLLTAVWWRQTRAATGDAGAPTSALTPTSSPTPTLTPASSSGEADSTTAAVATSKSVPTSATASPDASSPTSASAGALAALGCQAAPGPFTPTRFSVARLSVKATVVAVNARTSDGTMAPPKDQPWQVAWIDTTAKPGSSRGAVNLTAHTYHAGGALGNLLYATNPLQAGDVIALSDGAGHTACYRYTHLVKIWAAQYQSGSTDFYDATASPDLRIMVCWDYDAAKATWRSRIIFHATPITGA